MKRSEKENNVICIPPFDNGGKMKGRNGLILNVRTYFLIIFIFAVLSSVSCKKEEQPAGKPSDKAANPYSSESVFDEVKNELKKNPNDVDALYHLADLYDRNDQYAEAIDTYKKVIALKPDMGYAYFKMGTAYDRINRPAEAVDAFKQAAKYLRNHPVLYNNMGVAYGKLGKFNDEIAALKKAIKLRPAYSSARYNLGVTYLKVKNKKAAMQEYKELKNFDEGAAEALLKEIKASFPAA
jgi:tetratricopeptide (TPR) repeat protein